MLVFVRILCGFLCSPSACTTTTACASSMLSFAERLTLFAGKRAIGRKKTQRQRGEKITTPVRLRAPQPRHHNTEIRCSHASSWQQPTAAAAAAHFTFLVGRSHTYIYITCRCSRVCALCTVVHANADASHWQVANSIFASCLGLDARALRRQSRVSSRPSGTHNSSSSSRQPTFARTFTTPHHTKSSRLHREESHTVEHDFVLMSVPRHSFA